MCVCVCVGQGDREREREREREGGRERERENGQEEMKRSIKFVLYLSRTHSVSPGPSLVPILYYSLSSNRVLRNRNPIPSIDSMKANALDWIKP